MDNAWLLAGLGNPGQAYAATRHNAGFMVLDELGRRWQMAWHDEPKFMAKVGRANRDEKRILMCQPQTYMNASGEAIGTLMRFHRIPLDRVLIVVDDADLLLGEMRLRPKGRSGGHHGLDSVTQHLGSEQYARLRIGIAADAQRSREIKNFVLAPFAQHELELLGQVLDRACRQVECWLDRGIGPAMNQFNGTIKLN